VANNGWREPLGRYADTLKTKFAALTTGEPEDQLRGPFERLLTEVGTASGLAIVPIGEILLSSGQGKPDYGVECDGLLCGHIELKAPGKGADTTRFSGHDKKQWARFSELPNVLYSDGQEFALYQAGELQKVVKLEGSPTALGSLAVTDANASQLEALFTAFFLWEPEVPGSSRQLAQFLAPLCRMLRDDVLDALNNRVGAVESAAQDWRRYLFPGADNARFANDYAQTVTFALLLARSNGSDTLFLDKAIQSLTHANTLLARALKVLTDPLVQDHLSTSLGMLQRVIDRVPIGTMSGGRRDPWLHFYEDFLAEYDPKLRKDAGAYYTPVEVVQAQVRMVDDLLRKKLSKKHGFATGGVNVLDPAVGTGTYLLGIAEHALESVRQNEGEGALPARADYLASHLFGFEIMVGPYAVASLRLTRMFDQYGGHPPADGVQIMLNNTMESPYEKIPELPLMYQPIGKEHQRAKRVKETVPVMVCIGNPPYDRHAAATDENRAMTGGWVRWGETKDGSDSILQNFIEPVRAAGKGGGLKNLYNLYVYFWRWALWKTFEQDMMQGPGVVSYITASSFLDGDAFLGMRRHMRQTCDEIWVIDLGGEGRGTRQDENIFAIQTPVAITVAVRYGEPQPETPAKVHFTRFEGPKKAKLECLEKINSLECIAFTICSNDWDAPFRPKGQGGYFDWPLLTDLMPWQHSGVQGKRIWPIAQDVDILHAKWKELMSSSDRAALFKESSDRFIHRRYAQFHPEHQDERPLADLPKDTSVPPILPYGFRSFDRQYIIADGRLLSRPRPQLWQAHSEKQIYLSSQLTSPLGVGAGLSVSAYVPDLHYFAGRGAKDILPLYRDPAGEVPNLHPGLLKQMSASYGVDVKPEDVAAYLYAVLAHPTFTDRYQDELTTKELRLPITADGELFARAVKIGRELLFLHTYGERFADGQEWPAAEIKNTKAVDHSTLPEKFDYDIERHVLIVGDGEFAPVPPKVYEYEISGLKVVQSWLGYRLKNRRGKKNSPLDRITATGWGAEYTTELLRLLNLLNRTIAIQPMQASLLADIEIGPQMNAATIGNPPDEFRNAPKISGSQPKLDL